MPKKHRFLLRYRDKSSRIVRTRQKMLLRGVIYDGVGSFRIVAVGWEDEHYVLTVRNAMESIPSPSDADLDGWNADDLLDEYWEPGERKAASIG